VPYQAIGHYRGTCHARASQKTLLERVNIDVHRFGIEGGFCHITPAQQGHQRPGVRLIDQRHLATRCTNVLDHQVNRSTCSARAM